MARYLTQGTGINRNMKEYFCWQCDKEMPFLEEKEWQEISSLLEGAIKSIKSYRAEYNCDLATARLNCKPEATKKFKEITGVPDIHFETIYHHQLMSWGPECKKCDHLFRTPKASYCANCGQNLEENA